MRYCVRLPNSGPFTSQDAIHKVATAAERLGYYAVSTHDHVSWGFEERYHNYSASSEAVDATEDTTNFFEVFTTLGYLAGVTSRVMLILDSICLAWRDVMLLARQALTLHRLSKGRFVLCVGAGNVRSDFEVTGTPYEDSLPISLEKLKVLRMLIDQPGPISFEGKHVRFKDAELSPRPDGLQIWYAGLGEVAVKRAARYCDGWMPVATPERIRDKLPELRQMAEKVGRGEVDFEVATLLRTCVASTDEAAWKIARRTIEDRANPVRGEWLTHYSTAIQQMARKALVGSAKTVAATVREYEEAGATILHLGFVAHSVDTLLEQLETFVREVAPLVE